MQSSNAINVNGYTNDNDNEIENIELSKLMVNVKISFKLFKWIILLLVVIGLVVGIALQNLFYKPLYATSATFTISPRKVSESNYGFNTTLDDQIVIAETYVITGDTLKNQIINNLGENYKDCQITAETLTDTNLITVTVTSDSKAKAYVVLERIMLDFPKISHKIFGDVNVSLLDELDVADKPINASKQYYYSIGGSLIGLLIGFAIVLIYSLNLNLVSDPETLQKYVNLNCVGKVPRVIFKKKSNENFVTITNRNISDDFRESFQYIRTRTERFCKENNAHSILVTSTFPGEGKTTVSSNLALSLSQNQKSVIIVDSDLRHPSIVNHLGLKHREFALDNLLNGECNLEDALIQYPRTDIFILSCKARIDNAAEMINSQVMADIINQVKDKTDYLIIDSPPADIMSDSITLSKFCDASLFVVRQNYGKINNIIYAVESIKQTRSKLVGFILNDSHQKSKISNYSNYNYSYNYSMGNYNYRNYNRKSEDSNNEKQFDRHS